MHIPIIYNDDEFIPEGIAPVENSPFDFRKPVSLTRQMKAFSDNAQLTVSHGYNHAFLLNKNNELPQLVFTSPDSAKKLFISSDASLRSCIFRRFYRKRTPSSESDFLSRLCCCL